MIRDPKALADACARAAEIPIDAGNWDAVPGFMCSIHGAAFRFVLAAETNDKNAQLTELANCAKVALATLRLIGNERWSFREALQSKPGRWAATDGAVRQIRKYACEVSDAWMLNDRNDALIALELLCVACSDLASVFGIALDDLVMKALQHADNSEATT